jgi:hypothetical protein
MSKYILESNSYNIAAKYAAMMNWELSEWKWLPEYHYKTGVVLYEKAENQ